MRGNKQINRIILLIKQETTEVVLLFLPVKHLPAVESCIMSRLECQTPSHWQMPENNCIHYYTIKPFLEMNYSGYYSSGRT